MKVKAVLQPVMAVLKSSLFITIVGLLALALLIWFGGPLLAIAGYEPLASSSARLLTLLIIAMLWGGSHYIKGLRENRSRMRGRKSCAVASTTARRTVPRRSSLRSSSRCRSAPARSSPSST